MRSDGDIIDGFLQGDSSAFRDLLERFRPACLDKIELDHYRLWHLADEIVDAAELRLCEWRRKHLAGEPRFHPGETIKKLAWRITKQECEAASAFENRQRTVKRVEKATPGPEVSAEERVTYGEMLEEIRSMPEEISEVLLAEADRVINGGPTLEERFGLSAAAARKRLERARREWKRRFARREDGDDAT